jgi:hypothetical protein
MLPRNELVEALDDAFSLQDFDTMLSEHLGKDRERIIAPATPMSKPAIIASVVIEADTNHWALDLIRAARKANPGNPKLQAFVAQYPEWDPDKQPVQVNPFESVFMRGGRLFLKRKELRERLREIGVNDNSRVLAISGDRDTGKTYSHDFLHFILENYAGWAGTPQRVIYVDMDACVFEPEDLARVIGKMIGFDNDFNERTMPPDKGEQAPRRIPALIEWLGTKMVNPRSPASWIVLDGFRVRIHPSATHDLIRAIIDAVDLGWKNTRLLLLNYEKHLDLDVIPYILMEDIQPIQRADIEEFFKSVYAKSGRVAGPETLKQTVDSVFLQVQQQQVKYPEKSYFTILSSGLTLAAKQLLRK